MSPVERSQKISFWVAVIAAGLGLMASTGCSPLPELPAGAVWLLHPLLLLIGVFAGLANVRRAADLDRERWRVAEDPTVTSGEREYAHKHAERERRWAGVSFAGGPLMLGYWLAYQSQGSDQRLESHLLPVTGLTGFALGIVIDRLLGAVRARRNPSKES